jgi:hypothetical protein
MVDMTTAQLVTGFLLLMVGNGGVAWLGMKLAINGLKADVAELKGTISQMNIIQVEGRERLAVLETRVANLLDKLDTRP